MKYLQQYRIPFSGLKNDHHVFEFLIDKRFFDEYPYSIVKDGEVKLILEIEKQEVLMEARFSINGHIFLECDYCLSSYPHPVSRHERLIIKFHGEEALNDEAEDILVLAKNDHEIDFAPLIYEYINLAVPFHNRCEKPGELEFCDKLVLSKIKDLKNTDPNNKKNDPRWDILKNIKNN